MQHKKAPVLTVHNVNAAGIDVHSDMHMVCVPADRVAVDGGDSAASLPANVRRFGANSCDLKASQQIVVATELALWQDRCRAL